MKDESEILKEWFEITFPETEVPDPLEYIALKDTISFQAYLVRQRLSELVSEVLKR